MNLKNLTKKQIIQLSLLVASAILIIFGILTMLTAGEMVIIFPSFIRQVEHILVRYIVVILMMSTGILVSSNVANGIECDRLRKGLILGITIFAFIMTLPLVYVFIAYFPAMYGYFEPLGMVEDIVADCWLIFEGRVSLFILGIGGLVMSIVFLLFPLLTGWLALKGKTIKITAKLAPLPVLEKREKIQ